MTLDFAVTLDNQTAWQALLVRSEPRYYVLRDWERSDFTGDILRPNKPCVFRMGDLDNPQNGHYSKLNAAWQFFMFDLAARIVYGRYHLDLTQAEHDWLAQRFTAVYGSTVAFCNQGHGFEPESGNVNFVLGTNVGGALPAIFTLVCGGATIGGDVVRNTNGVDMIRVAHFDGTQPPPDVGTINPYTDPRVFFANTITGAKVDGGYRVYRFPQYDGWDVPVPLIASRDIYYPLADTRPVLSAIKLNPYWP